MECVPAVNDDVEKLACAVESRYPTPIVVVPSMKNTVPAGVNWLDDVPATLAVNVTGCPAATGSAEDTSVVVDALTPASGEFPFRYTGCGLPFALLLSNRLPDMGLGLAAVYVILIVQLAPTAKPAPHVVAATVKSCDTRIAPVPSVTGTFPVLASVTVCGKLVVFVGWSWNSSVLGVTNSNAPPSPIPVSATTCFPPNAALFVNVSVPLNTPAAGGVAFTVTVQLPPTATL